MDDDDGMCDVRAHVAFAGDAHVKCTDRGGTENRNVSTSILHFVLV